MITVCHNGATCNLRYVDSHGSVAVRAVSTRSLNAFECISTCAVQRKLTRVWHRPTEPMPCKRFRGQHTSYSEQAKAAHDRCNGGRGGACFRCKRAGVTCVSFKAWALEREAGRSPSCRQLASPGQTVFTHARRAWVWIGVVSLAWWGCGTRSTAVTGGRLCSRRLHCRPLGPALLADCLAILRSLTTTTRRRTLLGAHSGQPS
jgi:hypothetical protein